MPAAPDPSAASAPAPQDQPKVQLARRLAGMLVKAIKQIGLYRHQEARFSEFLTPSLNTLSEYLATYGPLSLRVEAQNFSLFGEGLFEEASALPYKFFKEGVRQIISRPGLALPELVTFTLVALSEPDRGADDLVAQLWRAQLEHVEYVLVDGFSMGDGGTAQDNSSEVQVEVDHVVGYLYSRLKSDSDDFLRFARVSEADMTQDLHHVDQIRGLVVTPGAAPDELKARLQREIHEDEETRLLPKLVTAIFQVVESGIDDVAMVEDMLVQLLDGLLLQEDFTTINQIVAKLKAVEKNQGPDHLAKLHDLFVTKIGEEQRLTRVGEILSTSKVKSPHELQKFLQTIRPQQIPILLGALETIELPESRLLVCDVLAQYAKQHPEPFVNRLGSDKPQTVRDMVYILEKSQHPGRLKMFGQVLKHPNLAVRLEAMNILAKGRTGEAYKLIADSLEDDSHQVRTTAARLLPELDRERAFTDLAAIVRSSRFEKKPPDEKTELFAALGSTGVPGAMTLLQELLHAKGSLLNKKRVLEDKLMAVHGLGAAATITSYKLLQEVAEDKSEPQEVIAAARKAMHQAKKVLFGEAHAEPNA